MMRTQNTTNRRRWLSASALFLVATAVLSLSSVCHAQEAMDPAVHDPPPQEGASGAGECLATTDQLQEHQNALHECRVSFDNTREESQRVIQQLEERLVQTEDAHKAQQRRLEEEWQVRVQQARDEVQATLDNKEADHRTLIQTLERRVEETDQDARARVEGLQADVAATQRRLEEQQQESQAKLGELERQLEGQQQESQTKLDQLQRQLEGQQQESQTKLDQLQRQLEERDAEIERLKTHSDEKDEHHARVLQSSIDEKDQHHAQKLEEKEQEHARKLEEHLDTAVTETRKKLEVEHAAKVDETRKKLEDDHNAKMDRMQFQLSQARKEGGNLKVAMDQLHQHHQSVQDTLFETRRELLEARQKVQFYEKGWWHVHAGHHISATWKVVWAEYLDPLLTELVYMADPFVEKFIRRNSYLYLAPGRPTPEFKAVLDTYQRFTLHLSHVLDILASSWTVFWAEAPGRAADLVLMEIPHALQFGLDKRETPHLIQLSKASYAAYVDFSDAAGMLYKEHLAEHADPMIHKAKEVLPVGAVEDAWNDMWKNSEQLRMQIASNVWLGWQFSMSYLNSVVGFNLEVAHQHVKPACQTVWNYSRLRKKGPIAKALERASLYCDKNPSNFLVLVEIVVFLFTFTILLNLLAWCLGGRSNVAEDEGASGKSSEGKKVHFNNETE